MRTPTDAPAEHAPPGPLPRLPVALLRTLLPRAERAEVLADLTAEYRVRAREHDAAAARRWLWRQAVRSAPALLGWTWWRGWTGFEPQANAYHPGGLMLKSWISDARYALRRLRARVGYTVLAVFTLALGVGGTAAVFGIARPLLFQPLPYAHAAEVGVFWMPGWWYEAEFSYLRGRFPGFRDVAAYRPADVTLRQGEAPARLVPGVATSVELFGVLGARPYLGRGFRAGEDVPGAEPVAVVSYGLWQELGGTPAVLGTRLMLDGAPTTVVGVMPRGFWFPDPGVRVWRPQPIEPERQNGSFTLVGRVAPGHDVRQMGPRMRQLAAALAEPFREAYQTADKTTAPALTPLREALVGSTRPALAALLAAMGLILLIACANVAALMLGQVEGRSAELAVRSALGANRRRLTQQVVVEALLVGLAAAAVGGALAAAGFRGLAGALPIGAWAEHVAFGWATFAAALVVAVGAVLLVVLAPSVSLWRGDLRGALNRARTGGIQGRGGRLERGLVVAEVALATLVASGATLLVRSVANLYAIDPGVDTRSAVVVDVLSSREMLSRERGPMIEQLLAELAALPGVRAAGATMKLPLRGGGDSFGLAPAGRPDIGERNTNFRVVSADYFATMGVRLRDGRTFTTADLPVAMDSAARADSTREVPVVVNEALARTFFPGANPIGRYLRGGFNVRQRIVGVVANVAEGALTDERAPAAYYLGGQISWFGNAETFVLRTARPDDAARLIDAARRTVRRVAPDFAVQGTTTMARVMDTAVGPARQVMALLTLLSALALGLGGVGIYGVIAHFAARRKRDWAIRLALGLPGGRVVRHIVGQGALLVAVGVALGAVGTAASGHLLASFLFGVGAVDPAAFAAAGVALLGAGVAAAFVPARRAGTVNPAVVLREQ